MLPAIWLSTLPGLELEHVWYLSVASVWVQAMLSLVLLRRTMKARLNGGDAHLPKVSVPSGR